MKRKQRHTYFYINCQVSIPLGKMVSVLVSVYFIIVSLTDCTQNEPIFDLESPTRYSINWTHSWIRVPGNLGTHCSNWHWISPSQPLDAMLIFIYLNYFSRKLWHVTISKYSGTVAQYNSVSLSKSEGPQFESLLIHSEEYIWEKGKKKIKKLFWNFP